MAGFDIARIDDVIHGRMRLGIMAYLADAEVADFNELKRALEATQGNLSIHLRKLEDAGYIAIEKSFLGPQAADPRPPHRRRPRAPSPTTSRRWPAGRQGERRLSLPRHLVELRRPGHRAVPGIAAAREDGDLRRPP